MKCTHCVEGKMLPAIPIPGKKVENFPNCDYCNGTGEYEPDDKLFFEGKRMNDLRISKRITLRRFCIDHDFDPVLVSKIERGIIEAPDYIQKAYESL